MPLVAITREMGSLGMDVAIGLSQALGVPLLYHEVIDHLADRMRVRKSHVVRLLDGSAGLFERLTADKTSLSIFSADEIVGKALDGGGVIRGWGATHLLRGVPHAICVRVCAPFEVRRQRMMTRLGTDERDKVGEEIERNDEAHTAIMRRNFSLQWTDAEHYDLVLNTQRVSIDASGRSSRWSSPRRSPRRRPRAARSRTWRWSGGCAPPCACRRAPEEPA